MGCWERGTQVNRIMKQPLRQMNIIERYITANKDESTPSGWKTCPTTKKNKEQNPLSFFFMSGGKKWPSYSLQFFLSFKDSGSSQKCLHFNVYFIGCTFLWVFYLQHDKNTSVCPPWTLIITHPFLIEWLLALDLISSFKSHAGPFVIYFCRRLPSAQRRGGGGGRVKEGSFPQSTPLWSQCLFHTG